MANVVTSVFAVALIMGAVLLLAWASLSSAYSVSLTLDRMADRSGDMARAALTLIAADRLPTSTNVEISIRNSGQTALRDFPKWDVIIQYYATSTNQGLNIAWMTHTTSTQPASGKWTVRGLYLNASSTKAEVYDPNVFNPQEEMILRLNITPAIPTSTDNLVTIGGANAVTVAAPFSR